MQNHHGDSDIRRVFSSSICAMDYRLEARAAKQGVTYFGGTRLPDVDIYRDDGVGSRTSLRTPRHIRADGVSDFLITMPLHARTYVLQAGTQTCCDPGNFIIVPTHRPFVGTIAGSGGSGYFSQLLVRVSGARLRQQAAAIDDLANVPILLRPGAGRLMKHMFEAGFAEGAMLNPRQAADFGDTLIQTIANAIADAPELAEQQNALRQPSSGRLLAAATRFIESNLSNPMLSCALVAAHLQVSGRSVQAAFATAGDTLVSRIREMRLQRCRDDLANPALAHHSVLDIANRWGFESAAHFSRVYKARFGRTPREDRI